MLSGTTRRPLLVHLAAACVLSAVLPTSAALAKSPQNSAVKTPADFEKARKNASDELDKARPILTKNGNLRIAADDAAGNLKQLTSSRDVDSSAMQVLDKLDKALQSLVDGKIVDGLSQGGTTAVTEKNALDPLLQSMVALRGNTSDFENLSSEAQNQFAQVQLDCDTVFKQLGKETDLNATSASSLQAALSQVIAQATEVTQKLKEAVSPLTDPKLAETSDTAKLATIKVVAKNFPVLENVLRLEKAAYKDKWDPIAVKLAKLLPASPPPATDKVTSNLGDLTTTLTTKIGPSIPGWITVATGVALAESQKVEQLISGVDSDAPANTASAVDKVRTGTSLHDSIAAVSEGWYKLVPFADQLGTKVSPYDTDAVTALVVDMEKKNQALYGALSRLQEAVAGDYSEFEADQVPLFYFTDVPRLMQMLNPGAHEIGGRKGAQEQAQALRQKLTQAELELTEAQGEVNRYQTRLMQLPEELKQARAEARRQDGIFGKTSNHLGSLTNQLTSATDSYSTAKTSATANPTDQQKQTDLQNAQKQKDRLTSSKADAQRDSDNAQHDKDVADQKLKAAEDEQTGIPAQIEQAKQALSTAQTNVAQRRQESLLAAQAESDAFAVARDNAQYWSAQATGISRDAARRVEMYGTDDSKIIYLRGKRADLEEVKNIIAGIDRPAPQARLTLWSLQLNFTNDAKGNSAKQVNQALFDVEDRLAEIRTRMAASVSLLRDSINAHVNRQVYGEICYTADDCRLTRIREFYDRQVLLYLGDTGDDQFKAVSRWAVPDPAGTTTLGEALMVLSLAKPQIRKDIFNDFLMQIKSHTNAGGNGGQTQDTRVARTASVAQTTRVAQTAMQNETPGANTERNSPDGDWMAWHKEAEKSHGKNGVDTGLDNPFKNMQRALDLDLNVPYSADQRNELTSAQLEILHALDTIAYRHLIERFNDLLGQLNRLNKSLGSDCRSIFPIQRGLNRTSPPAPCTGYVAQDQIPPAASGSAADPVERWNALQDSIYAIQAQVSSISEELAPLLWYAWRHYGLQPESFSAITTQTQFLVALQYDASLRSGLSNLPPPTLQDRAREAAGDEMLKEIMTAMEEDLDRHFVRPGVADLRTDIMGQGVQVGILQRTSTLATNRLVARVDPRSSAQLALGDQQDILQSVMQLGQIYLAAQSGGVLGTMSALRSLQGQTQEPPQEIYGLTTGSTFKVTPVFDPSGQALRFKFDYVAANNILEPNGTMNPQLPRIERHTVNTEVQISNLELREISRYEANSKLGLPTKYWGGIPILKDIPYVRPVPLIGWFVRKGGSGAASQESLLFGQSTIYPTIGDIMDLLTKRVSGVQ